MEDRWAQRLLCLDHTVAGLLAGSYDADLTFVPDGCQQEPGGLSHTADRPITPKAVYLACRQAARRAGLQEKNMSNADSPICSWPTLPVLSFGLLQ